MLHFVGDINLTDWDFNVGFGIGSRIAKGFDPLSKMKRNPSDCWIGNFEGVASDVSTKKGHSREVFRISPSHLTHVKHFDYYGFANNHAMQHGAEAYTSTVDCLKSFGCGVFGSNKNKSIVFEHSGRRVSLTGLCTRIDEFTDTPSYWYNPEYEEIKNEVSKLPNDAFKVLFVHWGNEYINRPSSQQKKFAHFLIDVGFDLIIGMHPHVLQGYEDYKGKRIYYSLGNFVFDMPSVPCKYGAIVSVDLKGAVPVYSEQYVHIGDDCSPEEVLESRVPANLRFSFLNKALETEDNSESYHAEIVTQYKAYRKINHRKIIREFIRRPRYAWGTVKDYLTRKL